jgi:hypothetical protein
MPTPSQINGRRHERQRRTHERATPDHESQWEIEQLTGVNTKNEWLPAHGSGTRDQKWDKPSHMEKWTQHCEMLNEARGAQVHRRWSIESRPGEQAKTER